LVYLEGAPAFLSILEEAGEEDVITFIPFKGGGLLPRKGSRLSTATTFEGESYFLSGDRRNIYLEHGREGKV